MILFILSIALLLISIILIVINRPIDKISIKESLDLCNLAVITLTNNGHRFNFMLDTGAVECLISKSALKLMEWSDLKQTINANGFNGKVELCPGAVTNLSYKGKVFSAELFMSKSLDKTFSEIKAHTGVQLHGIIGNEFLKKYGYILDFDKLEVYTKRKWRMKL